MFQRIASYFRLIAGKTEVRHRHGFQSVDDFSRVLETERHRADRTSIGFSLLTFAPRDRRSKDATYAALSEILSGRLRLTDCAGWLDDERIGVVFPTTPASGAWIVADEVCEQLSDRVPSPVCTVLCYPSDDFSRELAGVAEENSECSDDKPVEAMEALFMTEVPRWKRALDVIGASAGLICLSPILALAAIAVRCTSSGPIFYSQERSGQGGRRFRIYKFRSMVVDADRLKQHLMAINEQDGPAFKVKNDPRVTKVGKFLRATSIDELPQLCNVLLGDMSLVGPRPLPCDETAGCNQWQRRRLDVPPGLTCIWQVSGRSKVSFDEWIRMDIRYIRSRAIWNDLKLILKTIPAVLLRHGAH
jgi:lipopolysaccharide/colanic/teichoic acid biosynthesis glycosyltransferase